MCELLICGYDQTSDDFYLNCILPKKGDVISIAEDEHAWGGQEKMHSAWRIIAMPGVAPSDMAMLTSYEVNTIAPPDPPSRTLQYRGFYLDQDAVAIESVLAAYLADDTRQQPVYVLEDGVGSLQNAIAQRPKIDDPAIIGHPPSTVG